MRLEVKLLSAGYCTNWENVALKGGKRKKIKFKATFILIKHPNEGYILIDTGYSHHFFDACNKFPFKLYKKITPVFLTNNELPLRKLNNLGISPADIKHIVITHFHGDHIGGIKDFKTSKFYYLQDDYIHLKKMSKLRALKNGLLPNLIPDDFDERSVDIKKLKIASNFHPIISSYFPWAYDLFSDNSILIIELPGHAYGQIGILFKNQEGNENFYISDSCWLKKSYVENIPPHFLCRLLHANHKAYLDTLTKIHLIYKKSKNLNIIPSHDAASVYPLL